jgi:nitroimidazol reductase NimA-like FMN-containing flavoprotein (pyridoxamine 5'-phosphate oxidase superfamily)
MPTMTPPFLIAPADDDRQLVELDRDHCLALLATEQIGRLVFTYRAMPEVLPVNFVRDGDSIVVRLRAGSNAAAACRGTIVAFQVDRIDGDTRLGWSVLVVGRSNEITDPAEQARIEAAPLRAWAGKGHDFFVRIALDRVTGRELAAPA